MGNHHPKQNINQSYSAKFIQNLILNAVILLSLFAYSCGKIEENEPDVVQGLTNDLYEQYKNCQNNETLTPKITEPSLTTNSPRNKPINHTYDTLPGMPYYCDATHYPPSIVYNSTFCEPFLPFLPDWYGLAYKKKPVLNSKRLF